MAMKYVRDTVAVARMVKIEHSIFALPFAYSGAWLAARGWPGWYDFAVLTVAMVAVRSFAMAMNRLMDLDIDRKNPRTQDRPLVTGELSTAFTWRFVIAAGAVFVVACALMNWICLALSPVALAWSAFYSLTKRFTWLCHFALGSVLGLAPVAGWLCVDPVLTWSAVWLFAGVTLWVAGFDLLYALQDAEFDRSQGLWSLPARFGVGPTLSVSMLAHVMAAACFLLAGYAADMGWAYYFMAAAVGAVLTWEHRLIRPEDLSRINLAFFTLNGVIAIFLFIGVLIDLTLS